MAFRTISELVNILHSAEFCAALPRSRPSPAIGRILVLAILLALMTDPTVTRPTLSKSPTGIPGLDEITDGGLPTGRPTLVCGGPGSGKTLLGITFLVNGAVHFGEPGVLMSFEENADELAQDVASLGFDLPRAHRREAAGRRLRPRRAQRDRGDRRVRPRGPVRPPRSRGRVDRRQACRARHHRVAVRRTPERSDPARGAAAAVPLAARSRPHGGDYRRAGRDAR